MKPKIKIVCGYRKDQEYTVDANEAHKAYYLFFHRDKQSIFDGGLALKGSEIDRIVPDWNATMGWNVDHALDGDDWNDIRGSGAEKLMRHITDVAIHIAKACDVRDLAIPMKKLIATKYPELSMRKKQLALN
jgi:hypothetical protein